MCFNKYISGSVIELKGDNSMGLVYTIAEAKQAVKDGIEVYLTKDERGRYYIREINRLPFYLEGKPGIGKTEIVKQVADELGIGFVSFSLTHHTRNSLLGLPVIKDLEGGKYTEYTMSEIIAKVLEKKAEGMNEGILLLDEFSCVSESIMPAMLAFLQTKNIGTHTLPEGWVIVLCGNTPESNRNAKKLDTVILDRVRKINIEFDADVFIDYAECKNMHNGIISYLKSNPSDVYSHKRDGKDEQLVTCRGWENLSHALYGAERLDKTVDEYFVGQFIKSDSITHNFCVYYKAFSDKITYEDVENILHGRKLGEYANKYMNNDDKFWWNIVTLLTNSVEEKYSDVSENIDILNLSARIIDYLKDSNDIVPKIKERIGKQGLCSFDTIPLWHLDCDDEYMKLTTEEEKMLNEWLKVLQMHGIDTQYNYESSLDKQCMEIISRWHEYWCKTYQKSLTEVSDMLSNIISFLNIKKDNTLTDRVYQIINHSLLLLKAVSSTNNEAYINLCKRNYANEFMNPPVKSCIV